MKFRYFVLIFLSIVVLGIFILLKFIPKLSEKYIVSYLALHNIKLYPKAILVGFPNRFSIIQPVITKEQTKLSCKEIVIYFDWLKFIKTRKINESFHRVFLIEPNIILKEKIQPQHFLKSYSKKIPEINIVWKKGTLISSIPDIKLNSTFGKISFRKNFSSIETDFTLYGISEKFKLKYNINNNTKNWNAEIYLRENKYLPEHYFELDIKGKKELKGELSFKIQNKNLKENPILSGKGDFFINQLNNNILLNINNLNLNISNESFAGDSKIVY